MPKNKNIDHRVKETCEQVPYETDHIFVLCHSTMSSALNFCFLWILLWSERKNIIFEQI